MRWRIGVDIGGTFTDVALVDQIGGRASVVKTSTTPQDLAQGVLEALDIALQHEQVSADQVSLLSHATTVVTNALLEEKGAKTALIATAGFRDILELRRSSRSNLYDLFQAPPAVLVPRHRRYEVLERIGPAGDIITPLDESQLEPLVAELKAEKVEAVAVSLLFSFLNDVHEQAVGAYLRAHLAVPVFLSSEILPEVREFERTSTTAVSAYVGPILASYLNRLETVTRRQGLPPLYLMGSSGGVMEVAEALKFPASAIESGPAAGVVAAAFAGRLLDEPNLMTFDMGGTTAKASLIENGAIEVTAEYEVAGGGNVNRWMHGTGHPIRVPVIDLAEVSAGGGSIAWIDSGGGLRVGPKSAGAEPGPVCYDRGGAQPTITDCDLLLGYLNPDYFLGGTLAVDRALAEKAVREQIAAPLQVDLDTAAVSVVDVVNHAMAEALRIVSVERGHDPRDFSLIAFGGAGPVHAAQLAEALDIPRVISPPVSGGFSALGLVATDLQRDYVRTFFHRLDTGILAGAQTVFAAMEEAAETMLSAAAIPAEQRQLRRAADLRYGRQAYELTVPIEAGPLDAAALQRLAQDFHDKHRQTYGHDNPNEPIQIVNLRVTAVGKLAPLTLQADVREAAKDAPVASRSVYFSGTGRVDCPIYRRAALPAGAAITGPAIIEAPDTTIVVPPGWQARADHIGFIVMERCDE